MKSLKKTLLGCWDPFADESKIIPPVKRFGEPANEKFVEWLMEMEKKVK
jgi:hypothetical protein